MSAATVPVQQATIRQYAKRLQLVTMAGQFATVAEQAIKEKQSHLSYLEVLLGMEVEERERNTVARRISVAADGLARFPLRVHRDARSHPGPHHSSRIFCTNRFPPENSSAGELA